MKLAGCVVSLLAIVAAPASAHDFWLQPVRFQVEPGAPLAATFQVGHGADRQRWGNDPSRVLLFGDFFNGARRDRRADLRNGGPADVVTRLAEPGLHVLGMQTSPSLSELPAIRFNDYAKEEGLAAIIAHRQRSGTTGAAGRERYSRRAKALIQVGAPTGAGANQAGATRPIGLQLEIVPARNPYALGANRLLPVDVLYRGRKLANATVKLTRLENDAKPVAIVKTNRAGRANFRVPATGSWLLNVVWGEPVTGDRQVDYETVFSSLTFGYPPSGR